jgi:multicomponent K+:H+ antiporter subunit G
MNAAGLSEWIVAGLLVCSGGVVLVAALGLVRLPDFFTRMHAAALVSTLAAWIVALASIIHFTVGAGGTPALHTWLVIIVLSITPPVTTIVLARAALFRQRRAGESLPPPLHRRT